MTQVHRHILLINDAGVTLATYGKALVFRGRGIELTAVPKTARIIILDGFGGSVTTAAVNEASNRNIEVLIAARDQGTMALFAPSSQINASRAALKLRERQFRAVFDARKTMEIARGIVNNKIKAEGHGQSIEREFLSGLRKTTTTDDVRHLEAKAAQLWWGQWEGFRMSFKGAGVPAEWRLWPGRYIGRRQGRLGELAAQFTARGAIHPMQAMLNYSVGVLAGRMTRVVIASGLDAAFGFLHDGRKPGRMSLVWDCIEPHRPKLVRAVFEMAERRAFKRYDFGIFANDGVGLLPPLAREIAELTIRTVTLKDMVKTVDWIAGLIGS
jgi:CRISPR-associated endonuclease Cas1